MTTVPRILLVEDDEGIRSPLLRALRKAGFAVDFDISLADARRNVSAEHDLLLLDLGLPDGDGLDLCRELRAAKNALAIIILTARDAPQQRVHGLDAGADDYVLKPFHVSELVARIRSVLRRSNKTNTSELVQTFDLWADPLARRAGRGKRDIELKKKEFDLLLFLLQNPGRAWTRDQLITRVWDRDYVGDTRTVDLHVRRLRALVEDDPGAPQFIQTVWGVGYRMAEES